MAKKTSARTATFDRQTTETQIHGRLALDGTGRYDVRTGIRFFDHMLEPVSYTHLTLPTILRV